jgi:hypothetical protein
MKNSVFQDVAPGGSFRTNVSEKQVALIFRVERISELELAVW